MTTWCNTTFEPTDEIVPDLAESWGISDDGLVFTFNLHDHVVWSDGEPFTASDASFSLERMVEEGKPRPRAGLIRQYYESSSIIDDHTIEVTLKFPAAAFLNVLGMEYVKILPKHVVEAGVDINLAKTWWAPVPTSSLSMSRVTVSSSRKTRTTERKGCPTLMA